MGKYLSKGKYIDQPSREGNQSKQCSFPVLVLTPQPANRTVSDKT